MNNLKCYCGTAPEYIKESNNLHAYVCPKCGFSPDRYYSTKAGAKRAFMVWVNNPPRWRVERGER